MKFFKHILNLIAISVMLTSCVPFKDTLYLEKNKDKVADIEINADAYKPYRLQVDDILSVEIKSNNPKDVAIFSKTGNSSGGIVSQDQLYFDGYQIDNSGNIRIPVLGLVNVKDQTVDDVSKLLEKKLLEEYFTPASNLFVIVKLAGIKYTINGEIGSPGIKFLYQDRATIMEAIANSGDIPITGNRKDVQIIRKFPHGFETYSIDLTKESAMSSPNFYIQPNDYIIIKPLKQKTWGTGVTGVQSVATIMTAISLITTLLVLSKTL